MEKVFPIRQRRIPKICLMFGFLLLFLGTSVLLSLNQTASGDIPLIVDEDPADASSSVSVYLPEVRFTIAEYAEDSVRYYVTASPDFIGGVLSGVAAPGKTVHILRRHEPLAVDTVYTWWVNVTDGVTWINSTYTFSTDSDVFPGCTLFTPIDAQNCSTFLINQAGVIVHRWPTNYLPCFGVYLVENGSILRPYTKFLPGFQRGIQKMAWDGTVLWDFPFNGETYWQTHDVAALPNGNILILALERKNSSESLAAGRNSSLLSDNELWPVFIVEVQPTGPTSGAIVWEWHLWDHLIQDYDPAKENYGTVKDHPELLDVNYALNGNNDWFHPNTLHYNPQFDQIIICSRHLGEFYIIDHSTTTGEARNHTGGARGKGGDFLYRWGNPQAYRAGDASDQRLYGPHDSQWVSPGCPGEGNILVFNNGWGRPEGNFSSIEEITPPVDAQGNYRYTPGSAYEPENVTWRYTAPDPFSFYASFISGCERLPNGNTLICNGPIGRLFEVTKDGTLVWSYNNSIPVPGTLVFRVRRYYEPFSPPIPPIMTGPQTAVAGVSYNYTIVSSDPDRDPVFYSIDWGDNTPVDWIGPYHSGEPITVTHTWVEETMSHIRCRAKDRYDSISHSTNWDVSVGIPYEPSYPSPVNGAVDVDIHRNVNWTGGDPDPKDIITYDVCFGNVNPPPLMVRNQTMTMYHPGVLECNTTYYWRIISWDDHGMSATGPLWNFTTAGDVTAPTTIIHLVGTLGNEEWFRSSVTISFEANDTQSGVNSTWFKLDDASWSLYTAPVMVSEEGRHIVSYFSVDALGNLEKTKLASLKIDTKSPQAGHTLTGVLGNNSWYISNVTIRLSAMDDTSGISRIRYRLDHGEWTEYSTSFDVITAGSHTLMYYAVDVAGNLQQLQGPYEFKIDRTAPIITLVVIAQNLLQTKWVFSVTIIDETSGINKVDFYIDDVFLGTLHAPGPYDWYYDGDGHVAYAIGFDNAGNAQTSPRVITLFIHSQPKNGFVRLI